MCLDAHGDLPLFKWAAPRRVLVFPLAKRVAKVRRTAEILSEKQGKAALAYWRQVCTGLAMQLDRCGASPEDRDAELRSFFDSVQAEIMRLTYRGRRPGGDAA